MGLQFVWCVIVLLPMVAFWFSCCALLVLRIVCFPLRFVSLCQESQVDQELPQFLHYFYFYMAVGHTYWCQWEVICNAWLVLARELSSSSESSMDHIVLSGAMTEEVEGCLCWLGPGSCALNHFCSEWSACIPSRRPNCVLALLEEQWRIAVDGICIIHAAFSFNTMPGCLRPYRSGW